MDKKTSENVVWHIESVERQDRENLLKQKGIVLWFTGLSGSGKSTIANAVQKKLYDIGKLTYLLDGDNLRHGLNGDLGFSDSDRNENIRRVGEVAKLFVDSGIITLCTFVSPFEKDRQKVRELLGKDFIEVFIDCPLNICESRDPKDLYKKAREQGIKNFTGIHSPYEIPTNPEIVLKTGEKNIEECTEIILTYLNQG